MDTHVETVEFTSHGVTLRGRLARPAGVTGPVPVVVMALGLGATQEMGLGPYAQRFAEAGLAALSFDYRTFGVSDGEPRQLLSIPRQRQDYAAAVDFARGLPGIDAARVALWGSSFSGGHVIKLAASLPGIAAAVAQCPFTDGPSSVLALGPLSLLKVGPRAVADEAAGLVRRGPVRVPVVGRPGSGALMTAPDAWDGYLALSPDDPPRQPLPVAGRIGTRIGLDRPGRALRKAGCPVLVQVCEKDTVAPARATLRHARKAAPGVEVVRYPVGHFDVYLGEPFERSVTDQLAFLGKHLQA